MDTRRFVDTTASGATRQKKWPLEDYHLSFG